MQGEVGASNSPGTFVVQTQSNLIDAGGVVHDETEARLGRKRSQLLWAGTPTSSTPTPTLRPGRSSL